MARRGRWRHGWAGWWGSSVPALGRLGLVLVAVFALPAAAGLIRTTVDSERLGHRPIETGPLAGRP